MVKGLERFEAHFAPHRDQYVLIGGVACHLIFEELSEEFRATKDFDIVLLVEALNPDFFKAFFEFISLGGYKDCRKNDGKPVLYRFSKPTSPDFPDMLELFSRAPDNIHPAPSLHLVPIPAGEDSDSLSAILLNDDYYSFLLARKRQIQGIVVLDQTALIPFKSRAFLDLYRRNLEGEEIDRRKIYKHRNDVARLAQLLAPDDTILLPEAIQSDMVSFIDLIQGDASFNPQNFKVPMTRDDLVLRLESAYRLRTNNA
jgi:hypothetical protein